jgi:hypothetical protein
MYAHVPSAVFFVNTVPDLIPVMKVGWKGVFGEIGQE